MIKLFERIEEKETPQFSMPLSLRIIKEFGQNGVDYKGIHLTDVLSIYYSLKIDSAKQYLNHKRQEEMQKRGISSISKATEADFDNL
jgi:hypothetical protein